ncbi:hypothetical protein [Niallia circulans]|uniref:Uncharacterized protein n=1 Tax=Niallia circulans TaxID=1397 RepID=A0A941GDA0_NIACI|nr:hypothetical protein [Niallia circulans]MCB5235581.1 hypothetical protein [Niallia circulans]
MNRLSKEDTKILEHLIYLPLLLTVLERDYQQAKTTPFKLNQVYLNLIEHTMKKVQDDLKGFKEKMRQKKIKLIKGNLDKNFTEYHYYVANYHEVRRFANTELKANTEKLLSYYLFKENDVF